MQVLLPIRDVDWLDGVGGRAPSVIQSRMYTRSDLVIRDLFRGKLRFRSQPIKCGKSLRPLRVCESAANRASEYRMRPTEAARPSICLREMPAYP